METVIAFAAGAMWLLLPLFWLCFFLLSHGGSSSKPNLMSFDPVTALASPTSKPGLPMEYFPELKSESFATATNSNDASAGWIYSSSVLTPTVLTIPGINGGP